MQDRKVSKYALMLGDPAVSVAVVAPVSELRTETFKVVEWVEREL